MALIYDYHPDTGEVFDINGREARADEENPSVPIVPAFATLDAPPAFGANEIAVRKDANGNVSDDGSVGAWQIVEDHRGATYYDTTTQAPTVIEQLGPVGACVVMS